MKDRSKLGLGIIALALGLAAPVAAVPPFDNEGDYTGGDKFDALRHARAAYNSGDNATVLKLLRPLVDEGDPDAQIQLAVMYTHGEGVPQDYAEAARLYRRAAEWGRPEAQYNLGRMYDMGRGIPQDYTEAAKWYRKAAEVLRAPGEELGVLYENGRGVPQDYVRAYYWFESSGTFTKRDFVAAKMTKEQIAEAWELGRKLEPPK